MTLLVMLEVQQSFCLKSLVRLSGDYEVCMEKEELGIDNLTEMVSKEFNGILRANLYEVSLSEEELHNLRKNKRELRNNLKNCGIGDSSAKRYVKSVIKGILTDKIGINPENINCVLPFDNEVRLSVYDKFQICLYFKKKLLGCDALVEMFEEYGFLEPVKCEEEEFRYEISSEDISEIYAREFYPMDFLDKLDIVTQRIYENYKGLGIIDEIRDMKIDGVSGGVSGKEGTYNNVWIFVKGRNIWLSFLDFRTENELKRVCMNIYRYGHPGQLSMTKGFIVNEMKDHSRVVVVRPPFAESYAFFVRKFDTIESKELRELIIDENSECVIETLKWIVRGCQVTGITGAQGCGKTTLLMALIRYIHPSFTLRIQEMAFELHLREVYENRNILTFQETDFITGQQGLDLQKKTDGTVNILGEVATAEVASWLVQMSMVGSMFTMFTHHAKTTEALVKYMRNSLMSDGGFKSESIATEQVVFSIRFDVHMNKDISGHRFIERITEIVPIEDGFELNDIIRFDGEKYVKTGEFSRKTMEDIRSNLSIEARREFNETYCV